MKWYDSAAIYYEWVRYGGQLEGNYADGVVQKALDLKADTLAFCVQVGGYSLWDSTITPRAPFIGKMDLVGRLAELCEQHGLRFVPWWLGTALGVERVLRQHPSWQIVGPPQDDGSQKQHNYICYNTPYRELLYEEVREVLDAYKPDGIYFDQLPGSCYCKWCQAKFEKRYGKPMPVVKDEFFVYNSAAGLPQQLREFRDDAVRSFCAGIRQIIDRESPETCYAQNWVRNQQAYLAVGLADVLLPEFYQKEDLVPLGLKQRLTKAYFDGGAVWGNVRHSVKHDARHNPIRGTKLLLFDCMANLASPLMLDLCCMDYDPTGTEELAETFADIRSVQKDLAGASEVRYAALLHSRRSHELFPGRFDEAFEGMYRLLLESHVPFGIVTETDVQRGDLGEYKVLVMPDAVSLADQTVTSVSQAVDGGLALVATHMTGLMDQDGRRRDQPALADLFGVEMTDIVAYDARRPGSTDPVLRLPNIESEPMFHYGSTRGDHPLAEGISPERRFSFEGGFVVVNARRNARVVADIHAADQATMHSRIHNRPGVYPGPARWPLAVTRELPNARAAYFAPQLEATWRRLYGPELDWLLLRSILWAGGPPPVQALDCPASVEVRLFHDGRARAFHILLVNLTTNPLLRAKSGWGVIRYVTPQKQLSFSLPIDGEVKAVRSMMSQVSHKTDGGSVILELAELDLYDSLTVEYA